MTEEQRDDLLVSLSQGMIKLQSTVNDTRTELKNDIKAVEANLKKEIKAVDTKVDRVEANLKKEIKAVDTKVDRVEANLKKEIKAVDTKINIVEANLKKEIKDAIWENAQATVEVFQETWKRQRENHNSFNEKISSLANKLKGQNQN